MSPLEEILCGREERALEQKKLLGENTFVCQIAANVPGWPKRLPNDEAAAEKVLKALKAEYPEAPLKTETLANGAGHCFLLQYAGGKKEAEALKRAAVRLEQALPFGRIFDIDVITQDGAISRRDLGLKPRRCYICGREAKICARERAHSIGELRDFAVKLMGGEDGK